MAIGDRILKIDRLDPIAPSTPANSNAVKATSTSRIASGALIAKIPPATTSGTSGSAHRK